MDYKELIEDLNKESEWYGMTDENAAILMMQASKAITELLNQTEKAEGERDEYFKHLQGFCFYCKHRADGFDCKAKCYGHEKGSAWVYAGPKKEE